MFSFSALTLFSESTLAFSLLTSALTLNTPVSGDLHIPTVSVVAGIAPRDDVPVCGIAAIFKNAEADIPGPANVLEPVTAEDIEEALTEIQDEFSSRVALVQYFADQLKDIRANRF